MRGTRWRRTLRECAALLHRELRVSLTPVPRPRAWAFIVGCYNSGTTLLDRLLALHPGVGTLPQEGQFLTDQFKADYTLGLPRMWTGNEAFFRLAEEDSGPDPVRMKKEWGMRYSGGSDVLVEKSPPNTGRTRWLQRHFENAHFIALVRNGYAVAEGIRRKGVPHHRPEGWPLELCARQWTRTYEILREEEEHLQRVLWVRYEDLTEAPAAELERVFGFLGLDADRFTYDTDRSFRVHERHQNVRNMNAESIARLSAAERATVTGIAREQLERFGYELL